VLIEQMARLGTLEALESFEAQTQALIEQFLTSHRAELRPKNVKVAARVAVLSVRGVTLWTLLRSPEQLGDEEFIDEITDMVTRYLVEGRTAASSAVSARSRTKTRSSLREAR
jgi:hypothetical protein